MDIFFTPYLLIMNFCKWVDKVSLGHIIVTGIKILVLSFICYILFYFIGSILKDILDIFDDFGGHKK